MAGTLEMVKRARGARPSKREVVQAGKMTLFTAHYRGIIMKLAGFIFAISASAMVAAPVDYVREVKPIFAEHCYRCHGASQQKGELRMDTAALALEGGENGPAFKSGKSAESLMVQAIKGEHDSISRMPYKKPPLSDEQIALIAKWIDEGAKSPADEKPESNIHWAFVKPERPAVPQVQQKDWARNAVDNFILTRLEKEKIKPSAEADRVTLMRRVCLDLTGLPPSVEEVDAFVKDTSPDAYEKLVERLLKSPHYGERWGRHWLDAARYADSNGYSIDAPRSIWKYRDWVINALNRDVPFDQFTIEQLAGDLLPNATLEQKIATGFNRNTQINQEGGIDPEQFRVESVMDRVNTTATAFLGLTVACAQCHDHKFDPITQKEYYQFYAFFNTTINDGHGKGAPDGMLEIPGEQEGTEALEKELEEAEADLDRYLDTKGSEVVKWEQALSEEERGKLKADVLAALKVAFSERTTQQKRMVYAAFRSDDAEFKQRNTKLTRLEKRQPKPITTLVMMEAKEPRDTTVFIKGDFTRPGRKVKPGVPEILHDLKPKTMTAHNVGAPQVHGLAVATDDGAEEPKPARRTRLDLAHWIVDPENPLTPRVTVNRIWQQYFGRGIVETENDFGTQGIPPTHPELLDWLANELVRPSDKNVKPWSLKHIHRLIVMSATYRQSSKVRGDLANVDANNRLLARQNRLRLDSEIVRDVSLTASGLLNDKIGGASVFPPQPAGVMTLGQSKRDWKPSTGPDRYRRGMYTFFWRATPHPALTVFDAPDGFSTCTRRIRSNTPLQSLTLLNDEAYVEFSKAMATRILSKSGTEDERLERAFRFCLSRLPSVDEKQRLRKLLDDEISALKKSPEEAKQIVGPKPPSNTDPVQLAAWTTVSRVILNLDETITRE
jgi:mono/diheme cytochrome c family protein